MNTERLTKAFAENRPNTEMDEEEFRIYMSFLISKDPNITTDVNLLDKETEFYKHFEPLIKCFTAQVFLKRMKLLTDFRITTGALFVLLEHMPSPGACVIYLYYIKSKLRKPDTLIDLNVIGMELFPMGFFSEKQLKDIWLAQKVKKDDGLDEWHCHGVDHNLLDYDETWGIQI